MNLISQPFFLFFLPLSLLVYWSVAKTNKSRQWLLIVISLVFYAVGGWEYIPLLLALSLMTFYFAKRGWFTAGIILNLIGLASFKFLGWEVLFLDGLGIPNAKRLLEIALPLGLSYYTFKHISYLLDVKWKLHPFSNDFLIFAGYSSFFPQISAGPLTNFDETRKQLINLPEKLQKGEIYDGLIYIAVGLSKKILIANVLAEGSRQFILSPLKEEAGFINAILLVVSTAVQIYFDFSGYTDLVIGIGKLFGVQLPQNFKNPFLAKSIQDFWNHWHITLSKWFRVYLFFPLSRKLIKRMGSKKRGLAQSVANLITMFVAGLWHGITFGNVAWGILVGMMLNLETLLKRHKKGIKNDFLARFIFFLFIIAGTALFISPDLRFAVALFSSLIGMNGAEGLSAIHFAEGSYFYGTLLFALILTFSGVVEAKQLLHIRKKWFAVGIGLLLVLCIIAMGRSVDFFYVQF